VKRRRFVAIVSSIPVGWRIPDFKPHSLTSQAESGVSGSIYSVVPIDGYGGTLKGGERVVVVYHS